MEQHVRKTFAQQKLGLDDATYDEVRSGLLLIAQLIDNISISLAEILPLLPHDEKATQQNQINDLRREFENLINSLPRLSQDQILERTNAFKDRYWQDILLRQSRSLATRIRTDKRITSLSTVIDGKIKMAENVNASIEKTLDSFTQEATLKLAQYFHKKAESMRSPQQAGKFKTIRKYFITGDSSNSPEYWRHRRALWIASLVFIGILTVLLSFSAPTLNLSRETYLTLLFVKIGLVALFYLQMRFATKNYHIYSNLRESYEHKEIVGNTLIAFLSSNYQDDALKKAILENSSKVLFTPIESGHLQNGKNDDDGIVNQIINQLPVAKQT